MKKTVTVRYLTGGADVYEGVDMVYTEAYQWRLDKGTVKYLIPARAVRVVVIEEAK